MDIAVFNLIGFVILHNLNTNPVNILYCTVMKTLLLTNAAYIQICSKIILPSKLTVQTLSRLLLLRI